MPPFAMLHGNSEIRVLVVPERVPGFVLECTHLVDATVLASNTGCFVYSITSHYIFVAAGKRARA